MGHSHFGMHLIDYYPKNVGAGGASGPTLSPLSPKYKQASLAGPMVCSGNAFQSDKRWRILQIIQIFILRIAKVHYYMVCSDKVHYYISSIFFMGLGSFLCGAVYKVHNLSSTLP